MIKLIADNWLSIVAGTILGALASFWIGWFEGEFHRVEVNIKLERLEGD